MTARARRSTAARCSRRPTLGLCLAAGLLSGGTARVGAQAFSNGPLEAIAAYPADGLPTAPIAFVGWLRANATSPTEGQAEMLRQHLYAILAADARARFAATKQTLPARDSVLSALYDLADRMGVPGATLVATSLFPPPKPSKPVASVDSSFTLTYGDGLYTLAAHGRGWRVRFPHYFMIGRLVRQKPGAGGETDVVSLSTLCAANAPAVGGGSSATILLLGSPRPEDAEFVATWMARLGFAPTLAPADSPVPGAAAYYTREAATRLRKNLVILRLPRATVVAALIGLDGTYETNRPHFVDLLRSLHVADP